MSNKKRYNCKNRISDTCGDIIFSDCVNYDGILRENTTLDEDDCYNLTDVIEDIVAGVDQNTSDLDMSGLGCCLEYEAEDTDRGLTLKDVLSTHESHICDIEDRLEKIERGDSSSNSGCKDCNDGCDESDGCCVILQDADSFTNTINITQSSWTNVANTGLPFKVKKGGTYKIIVELAEESDILPNQQAFIGVSNNGIDPENNLFEQVKISPRHAKTIQFFVKAKVNDTIRIVQKRGTTNYKLEYLKRVIEKVK